MTEYDATQKQREMERRIRATKRELAGYDAGINATDDESVKEDLQLTTDWSDNMPSYNYKYDYNICTVADEDIFTRQCRALEKHIPGLGKDELLHDVDDSKVQIYYLNGQRLSVHNSYYIDAVFIKSEFDIDPYFE